MTGKDQKLQTAVMIIADGFDEAEAIALLTRFRQSGMHVKSVGLVSGLISGSHGILIMPDLTLTDLGNSLDVASINVAVLPGGDHHLNNLESDPRVHRLLRRVAEQEGWIVTSAYGLRLLECAELRGESASRRVLLRSLHEPVGVVVQELVRRLGVSS